MRTRGFIAGVAIACACAAAAIMACVGDSPEGAPQNDGGGPPVGNEGSTPTSDAGDSSTSSLTLSASIGAPIPRDSTPIQVALVVGGVDEEITVQLVNPPTGISATPKTVLRGVTEDKIEVRADGNAVPGFNTLDLVASTKGGVTAKATIRAAVLGPSGTLDPTLGDGGILVAGNLNGFAQTAVLDGDDKVVVAGNLGVAGQAQFFLMRYLLEDGAPDPTWNGGTPVVTTIGSTSDALALARQSDGKLVAAGWTVSGDAGALGAVARYNTNGTLDTAFGGSNTGFITFSLGGSNDIIRSVALLSNGEIVVGGQAGVGTVGLFALARLKSDGTRDMGFGTDAGVVGPYGSSVGKPGIREVAVYGAGNGERIVVAGSDDDAGAANVRVARYQKNGTADLGDSGTPFVPPSIDWDGRQDLVGGLSVSPTGVIVVGATVGTGGSTDYGYARVGLTGGLDTTFNGTGQILASFGGLDDMEALALQSDGKILAGAREASTGCRRSRA